jgi:3-methylcrotonyl-CoA carboxylase beta subunit
MKDVIARIVDGSRFREFKKEYGPTIVTVRSIDYFLPHGLLSYPRVLPIFMDMKSALSPIMASFSLRVR